MNAFHDQLMQEGPLAVLISQFTAMTGHHLTKAAINSQLNAQMNHHMSVLASWTCDDVSGGYSTFCDNVWPIWEIDFVNTGILTGLVTLWIAVWALIFGTF